MMSCRTLLAGAMLPGILLSAAPLVAQESAPDTQKVAQTQPAVPQAYQIDIRNVLGYQVISTTRQAPAAPAITRYKEMVVFDIDNEDNLVVYIGTPSTKGQAATPAAASPSHPADRHAVPGEHKPSATGEEAEKVILVWTHHVLGKDFTRGADGTVSFRPPEGQIMPYPVLPLPPAELKEKETFRLLVPDLALNEGKTLQLGGQMKVAQDGKVIIDGRLETKFVPGVAREIGSITYDIPASGSTVSTVRMSRRVPSESPSQPSAREGGESAPRHERAARPAAPPAEPLTTVVVQLVSSRPVSEDVHKGLIDKITSGDKPEGEAADTEPSADAGQTNTTTVSSNLWGQVDQLGTRARNKTDEAAR